MKQTSKEIYQFERYVGMDRWSSYYCQLCEILEQKPESVLEIGIGGHIIGDCLKGRGITYISVDIDKDLSPDVVADVTALPFEDNSFDVVCAFEILEHLPFEKFEQAIMELARVSRHGVLVSLPHFGPSIRLEFKIPLLPRVRFAYKIPFPKKHIFNGEHYWEIGKRDYPLSRIRTVLLRHFVIRKEFVPFENQYHHFFVLKSMKFDLT